MNFKSDIDVKTKLLGYVFYEKLIKLDIIDLKYFREAILPNP